MTGRQKERKKESRKQGGRNERRRGGKMTGRQKERKKESRKQGGRNARRQGGRPQEMREMCKQPPHKQQREQHTKVRSTTASIVVTAGTIGRQQKQQYPHPQHGYATAANKC